MGREAMKEIGNIFGFLVMNGVMLYFVGFYWSKGRLVRKSKRWPSALGEIIQSKLVRESNEDGNDYYPKIVYRYFARGGSYEGDTVQIGAGGDTGARSQAKKTVKRYPVGSQVLVYFDPEKPDRACLERRGDGGWVLYVLGIVYPVIILGVFLQTFGIPLPDIRVPAGGNKQTVDFIGDYSDYSYSGGRGKIYGPNALGQPVGADQFEGRFVFVEYAAPWCSSSGPQAVSFRNLMSRGTIAGHEVVFLTVMTGGEEALTPSNRETAAEWARRYGLDPARVVAEGQSSRTVPQHALFSPMGQTLYRKTGQLSDDELAGVLDRHIGEWSRQTPRTSSGW